MYRTIPLLLLLLPLAPLQGGAQAVTGVITDYNGYWKTSLSSINPLKPNNSHNLLAFTYNGVQYSTGVDDSKLAAQGESFVQGDFWSLPVGAISGAINGNTKVGFGALYDGVYNGASNPPPEYGISMYLTDGIKGLNIGTCIANLPAGTMNFSISNIQPSAIGDGVPDILVTQIADPSGNSFDRYSFINANGVQVGNYKDIVFSNITPIGTWTADFYNAQNPLTLSGGFTQTDRPLRLWAADLSEFGINSSNYASINSFRINLCGNSDVAFVGYNNNSVTITMPLPVTIASFGGRMERSGAELVWQAAGAGSEGFVIERSADGQRFTSLGSIPAQAGASLNDYGFTDRQPLTGNNYYRLRQTDALGRHSYSHVICLKNTASGLAAYPNPARSFVLLEHPEADDEAVFSILNSSGVLVKQQKPFRLSTQTRIDLKGLPAGVYRIVLTNGSSISLSIIN
jgi:hypothetical protein